MLAVDKFRWYQKHIIPVNLELFVIILIGVLYVSATQLSPT